jgi:hypothetical protein
MAICYSLWSFGKFSGLVAICYSLWSFGKFSGLGIHIWAKKNLATLDYITPKSFV